MTVSELMIKCLENEGVKHIFGVPGEENEDFLFALSKSNIEFVPTRHEQGAAFIANVYGRLTGKAGVCLSTLGPGATNLVTGLADANLDKAPVVCITGQGSLSRMHHESHQMLDIISMLKPLTKWNSSIKSIETVGEIVRKAFKVAESEKPGVAHIELPEDLAGRDAKNTKVIHKTSVRRPAPDTKSIIKAAEIIQKAKKCIILAGNGAIRNRASKALFTFATDHNIPVCSTFMGKGSITDRSEHSLFSVGLGFKDYVIEAFEQADVIITIGYDIAEYDPASWNIGVKKTLIHIDFAQAEVYNEYIPQVEIVADIAESIELLNQSTTVVFDKWWTAIRERIEQSIDKFGSYTNEFNAPNIIKASRDVLPDNGLMISDVGSHKMWIARNYKTYNPNGCIISNGMASMGISLPGGIAANYANSDMPVVCIMGDGGALMNIQELETARRLNIACNFIILNDNDYGLIKWKQRMSENRSFGTEISNPDFVKLAESFRIDGYYPKNISEFRQQLSYSIENKKLSLFQIDISTEVNNQLVNELKTYYEKN